MFDEFGNWIADGALGYDVPDLFTSDTGTSVVYNPDGSTLTYNPDGSSYVTNSDGSFINMDPTGKVTYLDASGNIIADNSTGPLSSPSTFDLNALTAQITSLSSQALNLVNAWKNIGSPAPRSATTQRAADGSTITPNKNGTLTIRSVAGKVTTALMPVGHPYVFSDGSTVVNNGDGTLTTITAAGVSTTSPLKSGGISNGVLMGGLAIGAFLMLRGK